MCAKEFPKKPFVSNLTYILYISAMKSGNVELTSTPAENSIFEVHAVLYNCKVNFHIKLVPVLDMPPIILGDARKSIFCRASRKNRVCFSKNPDD